jgi:hypothetical protein
MLTEFRVRGCREQTIPYAHGDDTGRNPQE